MEFLSMPPTTFRQIDRLVSESLPAADRTEE
jgi:hypothetical protein